MARTAALDARRAQLLALGKQIFSTQPYDAVSTEQIAAEAGISVGLLYHYFASKKGFYVASIRAAAAELLAATAFPPGRGLVEAAPVALSGFLDFAEQNAALLRGLLRGGVGADAEVHAIVGEVRETLLRRILAAAQAEPSPLLHLQLHGWLGFVEGATLHWLAAREVSRAELLALFVAAFPTPLPEAQA